MRFLINWLRSQITVPLILDVYISYYIKWLSLIREVLSLLFMDNARYQKNAIWCKTCHKNSRLNYYFFLLILLILTQIQVIRATFWVRTELRLKSTSAGVLYSRVFLGRLSNLLRASSISSVVTEERSPHFGNYCLRSSFVFSFALLCQQTEGWAK